MKAVVPGWKDRRMGEPGERTIHGKFFTGVQDMNTSAKHAILGAVTIGQSPRKDLVPEMKVILGEDVKVIEAGALDGLSYEEVLKLAPSPGDYVLVTRMADGREVKIAEKHILPRMQAQIDRLVREGADVIALLCTGEFPPFTCPKLLVEPQRVLGHVVRSLAFSSRLGVLVPDEDQVDQAFTRWRDAAKAVMVFSASPYEGPEKLEASARKLKDWGAHMIVMDCMGYTGGMKNEVRSLTGVPVILARSVVARILRELLDQGIDGASFESNSVSPG